MKSARDSTRHNSRIPIFYWIFAAAFLALIAALGYRQIFLYDFYTKRGERQSMRRVIEPGARGDIYDRNGKLLVTNEPFFTVGIYFNEILGEFRKEYSRLKKIKFDAMRAAGETPRFKDGEVSEMTHQARANVLNRYLGMINKILGSNYEMPEDNYNRHFRINPLLPFPLIRELTAREHAILAERIPVNSPLQLYTDTKRYYPYGDIAAHVLGTVRNSDGVDSEGMPGEDLRTFAGVGKVGRSGIERAFDYMLSGQSGLKIMVVDNEGFKYEDIMDVSPKKGKSMNSSLDIDLQQVIEDSIGNRKGAAAVLDVKTGEVLALASRPSYNPNTVYKSNAEYAAAEEAGAWLNRSTQGLYPPGSTFKIVTAMSGLMTGAIDDQTVITCNGYYKVDSRLFPCNNRYGHGNLNLEGALALSCNVFFYKTGLDCGHRAIAATAKEMGLDSSTGIEIGDSPYTVVPTPEYKRRRGRGGWVNGDTANISIGQGDLLQTPLQMACMTASFARGETRTKASIVHDPTRVTDMEYHGGEKLGLTREQYETILKGMVLSSTDGTSRRARIKGVTIAAKSGTAQVTVNGRPLTLAWMVAFAPADDPKVAMSVMIEGEEPGDVGGGKTAGPIVKAAMEQYFRK